MVHYISYLGRPPVTKFYPAVLMTSVVLTSLLSAGVVKARPRPVPLTPPPVNAPEPPPSPPGSIPSGQWNSAAPSPVPADAVLPVPPMPIPRGNIGSEGRAYVPPPAAAVSSGPRFRVVVTQALDPSRRQQLQSLVPDAFRARYQGRMVIQVGSFPEREKAEEIFQRVQEQGFQAVIHEVP
jgi:cell division septation protein DedD